MATPFTSDVLMHAATTRRCPLYLVGIAMRFAWVCRVPSAAGSDQAPIARRSATEHLAASATDGKTRLAEYVVISVHSPGDRQRGWPASKDREKDTKRCMGMAVGANDLTPDSWTLAGRKSSRRNGGNAWPAVALVR